MTVNNMMRKTISLRIWCIGLVAILTIASLSFIAKGAIHIDSSVVCYNIMNKQAYKQLNSQERS